MIIVDFCNEALHHQRTREHIIDLFTVRVARGFNLAQIEQPPCWILLLKYFN